ncbi:carbamoyltransferase C-terminal domain-containing protein [Methylobacterium komagatae]
MDVMDAAGELDTPPDVVCMGGWWPRDHHEFLHGSPRNAGYRGISPAGSKILKGHLLRGRVDYFSSSHERSHILCAFGMSPLPKGEPCYVLVWEGGIGSFYRIDQHLNVERVADVMEQPGNRYGLLYGLADPTFAKDSFPRLSDAGKLMALASFSPRTAPSAAERSLMDRLLSGTYRKLSEHEGISEAPHFDVGVDDPGFRNFAGLFSDAIFDAFHRVAEARLREGLPLLIIGGCGLNCDWNTKWRETRLFSDVFVPPVANDSGSAIGTAIDAQFQFTGNPKIEWNVYAGLGFRTDSPPDPIKYDVYDEDDVRVADMLAHGLVLGWVHGRWEIGPRALGNRSILAAPFDEATRVRLNEIKRREQFRPIAPVCLQEDAGRWFGCDRESPYMLFTHLATTDVLAAVTHVNGTARLQTVTSASNKRLHDLLIAFKARTGYGVLCNTSLNFNGKGCINNMVDLAVYAEENALDGFVVEGRPYLLKASRRYRAYVDRTSGSRSP